MLVLPQLGIVLGAAAIDSINPCAIGVLILMVSVVLGQGGSPSRLLKVGAAYIFAIFATYLIAGLGLIYFFSNIPIVLAEYLSIGVGMLVITAGILEVKDFFWYGKGMSLQIPKKYADKIHSWSTTNKSIWGVMMLGAFVAAVELPCTGAPYLAILTILRIDFTIWAFMLLLLYNFVFVLPLIVILVMVASGTKISSVSKWKEESKGNMRLAMGLMFVSLGWILILIANGTINFG